MREVIVRILDDLDRTSDVLAEGGRTVTLGYQGEWVAVDLTRQHIDQLEKLVQIYFRVGRDSDGSPPAPLHGSGSPSTRQFNADARAWGNDNGWPDVQPGKMPRALVKAYREHLERIALLP